MTPENNSIPDWAQRERQGDLGWIAENLDVFSVIASLALEGEGRGAIVVNATIQPVPGAGNPFGYFTQEQVEEQDDADITRMVAEYAPTPLQFPSPNPLGLPGRGFAADLLQNPSALHACPASVPVYTPTIFSQEGPQ